MLIIPAIDLKEGKVVRFTQGALKKKIYSTDPVETAKHWQNQGAKFLHIVDLDGARTGKIYHLDTLKKIVKNINIPLEFGGGVRDIPTLDRLLGLGVSRVVLGTKAVEDKGFLRQALKKFKDRVIISIDEKKGFVARRGWEICDRKITPFNLAKQLKRMGFGQIIYTDINRDGTLRGPNVSGIKRMLKAGLEVIASGGISSLEDIANLLCLERKGLSGIIVGKALYEGRFTLPAAIKLTETQC